MFSFNFLFKFYNNKQTSYYKNNNIMENIMIKVLKMVKEKLYI